MSKAVSPALKAHLAQSITTLALCWQVTRIDGTNYYFTSHDQDLVISGQTYRSVVGFSASVIDTGSTGEVDNLEVLGYFDDTALIEQDMKNGLFDYATVTLFLVNWNDLTQGILRLRHGWLGEVTRSPSNSFQAELRGLTQALVQETGTNYSPICRADLGDSLCKMPIKPGPWAPNFTFLAGAYVQAATQSSDALLQAIFQVTTPGTSGATEPAWNTAIGATTTDGTVTWTSQPYWRVLGSVVTTLSNKSFTTQALTFPAAPAATPQGMVVQGAVEFRGNVAAGTSITISDGSVSHSITAIQDVSQQAAQTWFLIWLEAIHDWQLTWNQFGGFFYFTNNNPAGGGTITKSGDTQGSVVIRDFTDNPIFGGALTWISGNNSGRTIEVKAWDSGTDTVTLWLNMYYPIQAGDRFMLYPGCDKRRDTCFFVFNNILNFHGEPDMPGLDTVLSYPNA